MSRDSNENVSLCHGFWRGVVFYICMALAVSLTLTVDIIRYAI